MDAAHSQTQAQTGSLITTLTNNKFKQTLKQQLPQIPGLNIHCKIRYNMHRMDPNT